MIRIQFLLYHSCRYSHRLTTGSRLDRLKIQPINRLCPYEFFDFSDNLSFEDLFELFF